MTRKGLYVRAKVHCYEKRHTFETDWPLPGLFYRSGYGAQAGAGAQMDYGPSIQGSTVAAHLASRPSRARASDFSPRKYEAHRSQQQLPPDP
jgi:hypothetical protein